MEEEDDDIEGDGDMDEGDSDDDNDGDEEDMDHDGDIVHDDEDEDDDDVDELMNIESRTRGAKTGVSGQAQRKTTVDSKPGGGRRSAFDRAMRKAMGEDVSDESDKVDDLSGGSDEDHMSSGTAPLSILPLAVPSVRKTGALYWIHGV